MLYINQPETAYRSLTIVQGRVTIDSYFQSLSIPYEIKDRLLVHIQGNHYDKYEIQANGESYCYYSDVTSVFGRGIVFDNALGLDYPDLDTAYPLEAVLGDMYKEIKEKWEANGKEYSKIYVVFQPCASDDVSQSIAFYHTGENVIMVALFKSWYRELNMVDDYPILHSYNLYKLFIFHQVSHILEEYDPINTETELMQNYQPVIGIDCMDFTPLSERSFANEYVNYTFWTHKPGAFSDNKERLAFKLGAQFGIHSELFTSAELIQSIRDASIDAAIQRNLIEDLG
ncbi:MAG: hypothetical protein PHO32_04110 [Candidatus Cloacimonetes bacterium]|nr:hypothetical protein [Candidatus Cloacimonadota bacterium]